MSKLIVIAAVILTGCAPMTPEQAARSDAALQNMIYQQQMGYQRQQEIRREYGRQMQEPEKTVCRRRAINPAEIECVTR